MNSRSRFLAACDFAPVDRVPAWAMRQAGRILPEYRALRERYSFVEIVRNPELAALATLQPIRRFPQIDAAITFSDILVVPEALGIGYHFADGAGIKMDFLLENAEQIRALPPAEIVREKLEYIAKTQQIVRRELAGTHALLGFAGAPWTLALYLVQGGHFDDGKKLKNLAQNSPELFELLMTKISDAVAENLLLQIEQGGVDAVQIFDSWASFAGTNFEHLSLRWTRRVVQKLRSRAPSVPVILFARGFHDFRQLASAGTQILSIDQSQKLSEIAAIAFPQKIALQGNLDPAVLLEDDLQKVRSRTRAVLEEMALAGTRNRGFIFNLGHGVPVGANLAAFAAMVEEIAGTGE